MKPTSTNAPANSSGAETNPGVTRNAPVSPMAGYVERGMASWYGLPFNGRRSANGEVYDMYKLTAAHRTLPFDTMVRVTNLSNGLHADVRITDRGPFVEDRVIDLSLGAARALGMVGPGTAMVKIEVLSGSAPVEGGSFTVQVGAFSERANAENLRRQLLSKYAPIFIQDFDLPNGKFYRVWVGSVESVTAAQDLAAKLEVENGFHTFVVRLDVTPTVGPHPGAH